MKMVKDLLGAYKAVQKQEDKISRSNGIIHDENLLAEGGGPRTSCSWPRGPLFVGVYLEAVTLNVTLPGLVQVKKTSSISTVA